ncbi:MAG: hypothetical protein DRN53_07075 [Thermoprotei archaeon]|nr:MAG: hypothetical protein DRN53_07075 [Thermoprotei archaeon]
MSGGGDAANIAVGLSRLEIPSGVLGAVGKDHYGEILTDLLRRENVDIRWVYSVEDKPTGTIVRLVLKRGRNYRFIYPGANSVKVAVPIDNYLREIRALYISGKTLVDMRRTLALRLLREAKNLNILTFLKVDSGMLGEDMGGLLPNLSSLVDYWLMSEEELMELLGTASTSALRFFMKRYGAKGIFVSMGFNGVYVFSKGVESKLPLPSTRRTRDVYEEELMDSYSVGFIFGILNGYDMEKASKIATLVGDYRIKGEGSWHLPTYSEITSLLG